MSRTDDVLSLLASTSVQEDNKNEYEDKSSLEQHECVPSPSLHLHKAVVCDQNEIVAEGAPATAPLSSFPSPESDSRMSSKTSPSILVTVFVDDDDGQLSTNSTADNADSSARARSSSSADAFDDNPKQIRCRPYSVAGSVPMIYRPLSRSSSSSPSRPSSILLAPTSASQFSCSPSSSSSLNSLMDVNGGIRPTIRLLSTSSTSPVDHPTSMRISKSTNSSLRTLTEANGNIPSSDFLRVPTFDRRRHSASLPSKDTPRKPTLHKPSPTSWLTSSITPPFSRLGLDAPGVVLPLTAKEFQQRQKLKEQEKRFKGGACAFSETPCSRARCTRRQKAGSLIRVSNASSGRESSYLSPLGPSAPLHHRVATDPNKSEALKAKVEELTQTGAGKDPAKGIHACRRYFTAMFVRGGSREKPESSKVSKDIPDLKERRRPIANFFSRIIGKRGSTANIPCNNPALFYR